MSSAPSIFSARGFLNTIGVNTHLNYTDGAYFNTKQVLADLNYIGVSQVRDTLSVSGGQSLKNYEYLAQNGVSFDFLAGASSAAAIQSSLNLINTFSAAAPDAVTAIEGLNEINNWSITWSNGDTGLQAGLDAQAQLFADVQSDPVLVGVPVYYLTGYGAGGVPVGPDPVASGLANYDNQHPYPIWGQAPGVSVSRASLKNEDSASTPAVFTETGYSTNTSVGGIYGGVDLTVQAKYTLDLLLDAASSGVSKTYLYDLLDAYAPGSRQGDDGFGLFDYTGAPKLAATALHNLTGLLQDTGSNAATYAAAPVQYTISGLPSTGKSLQIQKSNGDTYIAVWAEPEIWNMATESEVAAPAETVTIDVSATHQSIQVFDPLSGLSSIASYANSDSVTFTLTDHPILIDLSAALIAPLVVGMTGTVAQLAGLTKSAGVTAVNIVDSAANLSGSVLAALGANAKVQSITASDGDAIALTYAQYVADAAGLGKLTQGGDVSVTNVPMANLPAVEADSRVVAVGVSDTGAALGEAFDALAVDARVMSVAVSSGSLALTAAEYRAVSAAFPKISGAYKISVSGAAVADLAVLEADSHVSAIGVVDTAAHLTAALAALSADAKVKSIVVSDGQPLALSYAQFVADTPALRKIAGYSVNLTGTVYDLHAVANNSYVTAVDVSDTAADLSGAVLSTLGSIGKAQSIAVSDGGLIAMNAWQYSANAAGLNKLAAGSRIAVSGVSVANMSTLEADSRVTTIGVTDAGAALAPALAALGADGKVASIALSYGNPLALTFAQYAADGAGLAKISRAYSLSVTGVAVGNLAVLEQNLNVNAIGVVDTGANLGGALAALGQDAEVKSLTVSDGQPITLTEGEFVADATALNKLVASNGAMTETFHQFNALASNSHAGSVAIADTAANIGVAFNGLQARQSLIGSIGFTDSATPELILTQAQANADADLLPRVTSPFVLNVVSVNGAMTAAFNAAVDANDDLLALELSNTNGKHAIQAFGDNLTLSAQANDTFTLGGHDDNVVFGAIGFGADILSGYTAGDTIEFSKGIFANYQDLMSHVSGGGDTLVNDGHGDSVLLKGISTISLSNSMFKFA